MTNATGVYYALSETSPAPTELPDVLETTFGMIDYDETTPEPNEDDVTETCINTVCSLLLLLAVVGL